jgi:hypothetical protein
MLPNPPYLFMTLFNLVRGRGRFLIGECFGANTTMGHPSHP